MGFISNIAGSLSDSISSEIQDQYLETFRSDSLGQRILVKRAYRQNNGGRNQGNSEVISAGSKILVPEGTYALMVDDGRIVDSVTTPGMYTWDNSSSGSIFSGSFKNIMSDVFDRFKFAGEVAKMQRIYYVNGLEIMNQTCDGFLNVPYPDPVYGNLYLKFRIMFSFRIVDPVTFFRRTGKDTTVYEYMGTPSNPGIPIMEVRDHMQEALNLCAVRDKIPFPQLVSNKSKLKDAVNFIVSKLWREQRGMVVESIALTDLTLDEASRARVEQFDSAKIFAKDPAALKALAVLGFVKAMNTAAANPAGAVTGVAGVAMVAGVAGTAVGTQTAAAQTPPRQATCPFCGTKLPSQGQLKNCPACSADLVQS